MENNDPKTGTNYNYKKDKKPNLINLLKPYKKLTFGLVILAIMSNGINLILPKIIAHAIDAFSRGTLNINNVVSEFGIASLVIFILMYTT